ncbi:MFS transporter [Paraburkholderia caribensis]|uniref:MFS transporter n=1 Tax=Paraburkholderia caribensis TaxID=75105 RepID=A0A9Q6WQL2_9BURK|nr:MFS transporter [Paraburkholderia caribensis]MCO4878968.1 MFS transporter [Paraburkholderia caribensis]PTB27564.1 MFS transporter [Paraburkholderia caribensis]QLB67380.1 hypothetical protein A9O66_33600 [Paraburkholderia caribensis]
MKTLNAVDAKRTLGMLAWLMVTGLGTLQLQPVLGGALVDRTGITLGQMGMLFGLELIAMALGCGAAALAMNRVDRRTFCLAMLGVLAVASIGSALSTVYSAMCASRAIAGAAGGALQAVVYATTAARARKDQTFAAINIALLVWGALTVGVVPVVLQKLGIAAVYYSFVIMALIALPGLSRIPRHATEATTQRATGKSGSRFDARVLALLALFALLFGGHGALWIYQERIGHMLGMSQQAIGVILGGGILAGAAGAALAGVLGRRISHKTAQLAAFGGSIAASLVVVYGQTSEAFTAAAFVLMAAWFFGLTYLFALTAELDPTGRLTGISNAAVFVGQGLGPIAAAIVVGDGNFRAVGWLSAAIYLLCVVLSVYVTGARAARAHRVATAK